MKLPSTLLGKIGLAAVVVGVLLYLSKIRVTSSFLLVSGAGSDSLELPISSLASGKPNPFLAAAGSAELVTPLGSWRLV